MALEQVATHMLVMSRALQSLYIISVFQNTMDIYEGMVSVPEMRFMSRNVRSRRWLGG